MYFDQENYRRDTDTEYPTKTEKRETSIESAEISDATGRSNNIRNEIFSLICQRGGMICDEVEIALGMLHQSASWGIRALAKDNFLIESRLPNGEIEKRMTRSGRRAIVWVPVPKAKRDEIRDRQPELF